MKFIYFNAFLLLSILSFSQSEEYSTSVIAFQEEYTEHYKNPKTSPFKENTHLFKGHKFFKIDRKYEVNATFTALEINVVLHTSASRLSEYTKLGVLVFQLEGKEYQLAVFYNESFLEDEEYVNKAFVPFMDLTNGRTSYTNGRYCYIKLPKKSGEKVTLDFNTSTNPYCAYVGGYSCVIPPEENSLPIEIFAGIKNPK